MYYLYSLSIMISFLCLVLLLIRVLINRVNINFKSNKYNWKFFASLIVIGILPIINMFLALTSAYLSILMKKDKFIDFMNE